MPRGKKFKEAGGGGEDPCDCPNCECETRKDCLDPRNGCSCHAKCCSRTPGSDPRGVEERQLELVGS